MSNSVPPGRSLTWASRVAALALLTTAPALVGCSSPSETAGSSSSSDAGLAASTNGAAGSRAASAADAPAASAADVVQQASVISTGDVALTSRDVSGTLADVRRLVAGLHGSVARESTQTDDHGDAVTADLTLRVPTTDFDSAMDDLGHTATLVSTSASSKDVTTEVLDNRVRVQVAQHSIDRISILLDQATSIKDVISIERELAQRQADLGSLESQ